jgi:hypothetical protein
MQIYNSFVGGRAHGALQWAMGYSLIGLRYPDPTYKSMFLDSMAIYMSLCGYIVTHPLLLFVDLPAYVIERKMWN